MRALLQLARMSKLRVVNDGTHDDLLATLRELKPDQPVRCHV